MRHVAGAVFLTVLAVSAAFSQNAQLGGIVTDTTGALMPGVTITATNTGTGVATMALTNESGAYTFPSLQPGRAYIVSASLPGFQTVTLTDIDLGPTAVRQNFRLEVGTVQTVVEVSADSLNAIATTSASVGDVLNESRINNLPVVGNNVLSFLNVLPGLRISAQGAGGLSGPQLSTINGLGLDSVSVTRDGLTQNDTRFSAAGDVTGGVSIPHGGGIGVMSPTTINPDLVGEVRLILSPVDAELGRGNSQIQVQTRSGTNTFNGAASWNAQNSSLNANTWNNNRQVDPRSGAWSPLRPDWRNVHQYTVSYGGPIVKNKTFFFALWDQNISYLRQTINAHVLTNEARQGIFRFWEGWVGRSADPINNPTSFATAAANANPTIVSVDLAGKPLRPPSWPDGTPYTGRLVCFSVFGNVKLNGSPFTQADCPSGVDSVGNAYAGLAMFPNGSSWDPRRPALFDNRGYFAKVLAEMPEPNNFFHTNGDGLTMGVHQWLRTKRIGDPTFYNETLIGNDPYSNRKQFNIKIDHNLTMHRFNGSWSYQMDDNVVLPGEWPGGVEGLSYRRPQVFNFNVTSTLNPSLLNEARFGYRTNKGSQIEPWEMEDSNSRDRARQYLGEGGVRPGGSTKYPVLVRAAFPAGVPGGCVGNGAGPTDLTFDNGPMGSRLNCNVIIPNLLDDPLFQFVNNVSWTRGKHAFKFGGDVRLPRTNGYAFQPYINAPYGNLGGTATQSPLAVETAGIGTPQLGTTQLPANGNYATAGNIFRGTSRALAANLAYLLTESVGALNTPYWIESQTDKDAGVAGWQDITTRNNRYRSTVSTDYAFFAKDDFKVSQNVTLNLGVRYEYFSPPYIKSGLTVTPADLGDGMFGASRGAGGQLFDNWLQPGNLFLSNYGARSVLPAGAIPLECRPGVRQSPLLPVSTCDPNTLTTLEFVGPGSSNPNKTIIPRNRMNLGPAVGFAWQLPWFGQGKTTVRGGYSIQHQRISIREDVLAPLDGGNTRNQTAAVTDADIASIIATRAVNFNDLATLVPRRPDVAPGLATPVYARGGSFAAYDPHLSNPYVQNLTLSVTRTLSRTSTLDVRYVGTLARKQLGGMDLNTSTVMYNSELFRALEVTRRGGDDPLFDQMFAGLRLSGVPASVPVVNGTTSRGSEQLRQSTATRATLANGNFVAVANSLIGLTIASGAQGITGLSPGPAFAVLHNGCDRLAMGLTIPETRCFPENYLTANPQLLGATYIGNLSRSNYHALQASYTLRPTLGFSVQTTYSWAKSMQLSAGAGPGLANAGSTGGAAYTDPLMRDLDRARGIEGLHSLRSNGTIELPFGPNKLLFSGASGWVARLIEGWQTSFILNLGTGAPVSIGGAETMRYGNARYVVASPLWEIPKGEAKWDGPQGNTGTFFGDKYVTQRDPQCLDTARVASSLTAFCTLNSLAMRVPANTPGAIVLADGSSVVNVLVNPNPGGIGTLGSRTLDTFGTFFLDGNIQKTFRITERKQLSLRVDATNILNHPQLNSPNFTVGGTPFGQIAAKGAASFTGPPVQRNFQAQVRLTF